MATDSQQDQRPDYGVTMIDGKPATSLRFERTEKNGDIAHTVSFHMANKQVARLKDLDADGLREALGDKNAETVLQHAGDRGSLKGEELQYTNGLSPEEKARRLLIEQEQSVASATLNEQDSPEEVNKIEWAPEHEQVNLADAKTIAARLRQRDRESWELSQQGIGLKAESTRIRVENLEEKAEEQADDNRLAERTEQPTDYQSQVDTEREKNRQALLMDSLHHQFRVAGPRYHFKDQPGRIAFKDKGSKMVSASNDERVAHAMATMADAKGWKTITVSGHPEFQREVWMEASLRGIEVRGFKPKQQDLEALEARRERSMGNTVEHTAARDRQKTSAPTEAQHAQETQQPHQGAQSPKTRDAGQKKQNVADLETVRSHSGRLIEHGEAPYNHDPQEQKNYFVKIQTPNGKEETVWGVDLKRGMKESKARPGENVQLDFKGKQSVEVTANVRDENGHVVGTKKIETERNTWHVRSDRAKVVGALADQLIDKTFKDPARRDAARKAVGERLDALDKQGAVPPVLMYDKNAPTRGQDQERARPQVERNAERTR